MNLVHAYLTNATHPRVNGHADDALVAYLSDCGYTYADVSPWGYNALLPQTARMKSCIMHGDNPMFTGFNWCRVHKAPEEIPPGISLYKGSDNLHYLVHVTVPSNSNKLELLMESAQHAGATVFQVIDTLMQHRANAIKEHTDMVNVLGDEWQTLLMNDMELYGELVCRSHVLIPRVNGVALTQINYG